MPDPELVARKTEEDGVEVLTLRHPPVNALSTSLLEELGHHLDALDADPNVRAVVVTGEGAYFSAGADLKELATLDLSRAPAIVAEGQALFSRLEGLRPPVIAAINGLALGGGLELALACDLRIVGDSAKLGAPEVSFGLMPSYGGTQRLPRLIGPSKAKEMIFTGTMVPAAECVRIGLANRSVPSGQELRAARDLAHTIAQRAPKAVQAAKRAIREGSALSLVEGLDLEARLFASEVVNSADLGEGIAAFLERRPPKFHGA
ncbi:MAG TPA: enoyl-CoA hydratase-related protein [Thermoplasmata archaeon]